MFISYLFQLQFRRDDSSIWWRNLPEKQYCEENAIALEPGKIDVDSIQLQFERLERVPEIATQYRITFALSWKPPVFLYGGNRYEIYVGDRHVSNEGGIHNPFSRQVRLALPIILTLLSMQYIQTYELTYFQVNMTSAVIRNETIFITEGADNLFVQVSK